MFSAEARAAYARHKARIGRNGRFAAKAKGRAIQEERRQQQLARLRYLAACGFTLEAAAASLGISARQARNRLRTQLGSPAWPPQTHTGDNA